LDASMEIFALCFWTFLQVPVRVGGGRGTRGVERVSAAAGRESDAGRGGMR